MRFRWKSTIKQRLFLFNSLNVIVMILAIAVILNIVFEKTITRKAKVFQQREVSLVCNNIELLVNNINDYILTLSVDGSVQEVLKKYDGIPEGAEERYNLQSQIQKAVYAKSALNYYMDSVAVMSKEGTFFDIASFLEENLRELIKESGKDLDNMKNKPVWYGPVKMNNGLGGKQDVFVITKPIVDIWSPDVLGYVFVIVREDRVSNFYQNLMEKNTKLYVLDEGGRIISSVDKALLHKSLDDPQVMSDNSQEYVVTRGQITKNNWEVVDMVPKAFLVSEMSSINLLMIQIGLAAILVSFFFSYLISSKVTKPIQELATTMKSYDFVSESGHAREVESPIELNLLTRRFNQLVDRVQELMKQIERENEKKRDYEFRLIQAQIKPHFLYNSLETIISLIGISMNRQAMQYTKSLGTFYRISLSSGRDIITLKEEMDGIRNYLYMQGIRYVDKMEYEIEDSPELDKCSIPKLTLQPLVENAIYHGIKPKRMKSMLKICCQRDGDDIVISVWDNGVGMKPEKIQTLLQKEKNEEYNSFGLKSIDNRLKLVFGKEYGICIYSEYGEYTEVKVRIPLQ